MIDRVIVTQDSQSSKCTSHDQRTPVCFLYLRHNMIFCQDNNRKKSRYQISEEALLNGRKLTRQPDTDIHAGKEKCRQNDHDHSLYIIFLFHMISPYLSLFQCFYHNTIPEEDTIEILCNCSQITIVFVNFSFCKIIYSDFDIFRL